MLNSCQSMSVCLQKHWECLFSEPWCAGAGPLHDRPVLCSGGGQSGGQRTQNVRPLHLWKVKHIYPISMCYFEASWLFLNSRCRDFAVKMASAIRDNSASNVHTINLSVNAIEDKGSDANTLCNLRFGFGLFTVFCVLGWCYDFCLPTLRCDCSQSEFVQIVPWPQPAEPIQGLHVPERCSFYLLLLLYMSRFCFTTTKVAIFKIIKG